MKLGPAEMKALEAMVEHEARQKEQSTMTPTDFAAFRSENEGAEWLKQRGFHLIGHLPLDEETHEPDEPFDATYATCWIREEEPSRALLSLSLTGHIWVAEIAATSCVS